MKMELQSLRGGIPVQIQHEMMSIVILKVMMISDDDDVKSMNVTSGQRSQRYEDHLQGRPIFGLPVARGDLGQRGRQILRHVCLYIVMREKEKQMFIFVLS
jgi:hypothetical protein